MSAGLRASLNRAGSEQLDLEQLKGLLSDFQLEKLGYFFSQFFDHNKDGIICAADFAGLNERLRVVSGWDEDQPEYLALVDNNRVFLECLLEQALAAKDTEGLENRTWAEAMAPCHTVVSSVSLNSWLQMWAQMCKGSAGIGDFPIWVQILPKVMFNVICAKEAVNVISRDSLKNFYANFTGLKGETLEKIATEGFRAMSANGDYELDFDSYKLLFSNFLLGKTIYGPGKYIFGCFDNRDIEEKYKIIYDA